MEDSSRFVFEFDTFVLDPAERKLENGGTPIHLSPRAFDVLLLLVRNNGNLVEKQELIRLVWNDQFVEEANIQVQISAIRRALGTRDNGDYIETVPKKGYRFKANVKVVELRNVAFGQMLSTDNIDHASFDPHEQKAALPLLLRRPLLLASLLLAGALISLSFVFFRGLISSERVRDIKIAKLSDTGKVRHAAISPDGTNLVYALFEGGSSSLWLRNLPSGAEKLLLSTRKGSINSLVFSPDGSSVYYTQTDGSANKLLRIPILSGEPQVVTADLYGRVTFSPDGERIGFIRVDSKNVEFKLIAARPDGSDEAVVATSKSGELFHSPAWSPNSKTIALFQRIKEWDEFGNRFGLVEVDVKSGSIHRIGKQAWQSPNDIAWLRNKSGLLMTASNRASASAQLWFVDPSSGEAKQITADSNSYGEISVDNDSTSIAAVQKFTRSGIWINESEGDLTKFSPVPTGPDLQEGNFGLSLSMDGRLAFTARTNGNRDIWTVGIDGNNRKKLTTNDYFDIEPLFTPDGKTIVFISQVEQGMTHIWRMDSNGGNKIQLTNGFAEDYPVISPDGKWIVYLALDDFQKSSIRKVAIEGGEQIEISELPGVLPVRSKLAISPDGKFIAFASLADAPGNSSHHIWIIPFEGGDPVATLETPADFVPNTYIQWNPDGTGITYKACAQSCNLWNLPIDGSSPYQVTEFDSDQIYAFDWSWDGKRLAIARGGEFSDVVVVRDFNWKIGFD